MIPLFCFLYILS